MWGALNILFGALIMGVTALRVGVIVPPKFTPLTLLYILSACQYVYESVALYIFN